MSYLPCTEPIPPCPICPSKQICTQISRTNTQCAQNVCMADTSASDDTSNPLGGTIGGALGGVLGIVAGVGLIYWFWWKPRGLAAARQRYSRHLSLRQSRIPNGIEKSKKEEGGVASKRTSLHIRMDGGGNDNILSRRNSSMSAGVGTGTGTGSGIELEEVDAMINLNEVQSEFDNPFSDVNQGTGNGGLGGPRGNDRPLSTRTSEFSFRSSTSTNIIPIAYIPPQSSSTALEDSNNSEDHLNGLRRTSNDLRYSVPMSIDSRNSTDLLQHSPTGTFSILRTNTLDSPTVPTSAATLPGGGGAGGAPIRPMRSPGLDLQLPHSPPAHSPTYSQQQLQFQQQQQQSANQHLRPAHRESISNVLSRQTSHLSTYSTMSSSTSRSDGSTLSYILDGPQIITPVNAQGIRRVEVMGRGQAGLVRIAGSAGGSSPNTPAYVSLITPTSSIPGGTTTFGAQQLEANPFADEASIANRFSVGDVTSGGNSSSAAMKDDHYLQPVSESSFNSSFRDSHFQILGGEDDDDDRNSSRPHSFTSARSEVSSQYLDGMPFIIDPTSSSHNSFTLPTASPHFPPLPSTSSMKSLPSQISLMSDSNESYFQPNDFNRNSTASSNNSQETSQDLSPLPTPFLPFAGQHPSSIPSRSTSYTSFDSAHSQLPSDEFNSGEGEAGGRRSGFSSGLSQIPFRLGFPSGLGEGSERGSMMSMALSEEEGVGGEENPFGEQAEVESTGELE